MGPSHFGIPAQTAASCVHVGNHPRDTCASERRVQLSGTCHSSQKSFGLEMIRIGLVSGKICKNHRFLPFFTIKNGGFLWFPVNLTLHYSNVTTVVPGSPREPAPNHLFAEALHVGPQEIGFGAPKGKHCHSVPQPSEHL